MTSPNVAVILLAHDDYAERYLAECAASLRAQTYPADQWQLFIVSNGLTDQSRQLIAQLAPQARLLHNAANLGWTGGNNTAIRVALEEGFSAMVMLNVNVIVSTEWLEKLVEAAASQDALHIFQSTILLHGSGAINSRGNRIHYLGYGYCDGYGEAHDGTASCARVDYASGAAMLVKREVFEAIGLFREDYFIYYDDLEFCWRARLAGFNVGVAAASVCSHKYDFQNTLRFLYYLQRNRLLTLLTLERVRTLVVILPCLLAGELVMSLYLTVRGRGMTQWRVLQHFLRLSTWQTILAYRRSAKRLRTRKDAEIVRHFTGRVTFAEADHPLLRYVFNPLLWLYWALVRGLIVW